MLSDKAINKVINDYVRENPGTRVNSANREDIINAYKDVAMQEVNLGKTVEQHEILVENALTEIDLNRTDTIYKNLNDYRADNGDIRFTTYLDEFLYNGAAVDVLNVLREYNLPADALRGLKLHQNQSQETIPGVEVEQHWVSDENDIPTSPYVADVFNIYYNGQLIFSLDDITPAERFEKALSINNEIMKSVSGKSILSRQIETSDGEFYSQWLTKKGVQYKDSKGRFVSKDVVFGGE